MNHSNPHVWIAYGDSITHGALHTGLRRSWFELVEERVRYQLGRTSDTFINRGVLGWTTTEALEHFDAYVRPFSPNTVILGFGTNDALQGPEHVDAYARNLTQLITRVRALSATPMLHIPTPVLTQAAELRFLEDYVIAARETASTLRVHTIDHAARWQEAWNGAPPIEWMNDPVHPNAEGHLAMAREFLKAAQLGPFELRTVQFRDAN